MNFELIDRIQDVITIIAIPVFSLVMIYILYFIIKINKKIDGLIK